MRLFRSVLLAAGLGVGAMVAACGDSGAKPAGVPMPAATPDAAYTVNGEVTEMPIAGNPRSEFRVHHEAIDDFKDRAGKVVGMSSMVMEFPPAAGVDVSGLKVGDKVRVSFSVWWKSSPPWLATKVEKLPPETAIEFRKKKPPADAPPQ